MTKEKTNPISGYELTLMPPRDAGGAGFFGWIRLANGDQDAGYIYLISPPVEPHLNSDATYIVTSVDPNMLLTMLHVLQHEHMLQIRFFDAEVKGNPPSVSIESSLPKPINAGERSVARRAILDEVAGLLDRRG